MQGLRTYEGEKSQNFFSIVQQEAGKIDCVFFLDNFETKSATLGDLECNDMCGWLIPKACATVFERFFMDNSDKQFDYDDYYMYVDFKVTNDQLEIIWVSND